MRVERLLFGFYLFISPIIVAAVQLSFLTFPTINFFTGASYTPYPQIFYLPIIIGFLLLVFGLLTTFALNYINQKSLFAKHKKVVWVGSPLLFSILFWFGINLSQRAVIFDYLSATNANGLHFLRMFSLPTLPEVFPRNGQIPFYTAVAIGMFGIVVIIANSYVIFHSKSQR
jgi:hypothetical protein